MNITDAKDQSFEAIIAKLKETLRQELSSSPASLQPTTGQSILRLALIDRQTPNGTMR
jgi:hypothetical protein